MSDQDDSSRAQVEPSTSTSGTDLVPFWTASSRAAAPLLSSIRSRLPHFPSPTLRVQRVNQLDAELLDQELVAMLLEPLKGALQLIKVRRQCMWASRPLEGRSMALHTQRLSFQ